MLISICISPHCLFTIHLQKGAATKRAILRARSGDHRLLTYKSKFNKSIWTGVVQYLEDMESVAETNAVQIKSDSKLTENVDTEIHAIYEDALVVARAMSRF